MSVSHGIIDGDGTTECINDLLMRTNKKIKTETIASLSGTTALSIASGGAIAFTGNVVISGSLGVANAPLEQSASVGTLYRETAILTETGGVGGDRFGDTVAMSGDGKYVMAGPNIFVRDGGSWAEQTVVSDFTSNTYNIDLNYDGSYAAAADSTSVSVYIYVRSGTTWTKQQTLTQDSTFGSSVALSSIGASYLAVGASVGSGVGSVYIFLRSGTTWTKQQQLTPSDNGENFGHSVALNDDGSYLIVGASTVTQAYVFSRSGTTWTQQQILAADPPVATDGFGTAVKISGDAQYAVVISIGAGAGGTGIAYIYRRAASTWTQQTSFAGDATNFAGPSLSRDGRMFLMGKREETSFTGAAYVLVRVGTTWAKRQRIVASDAAVDDDFGDATAMSADGRYAVVGAPGETSDRGALYMYELDEFVPNRAAGLSVNTGTSGTLTMSSTHNVLLCTGTWSGGITIALPTLETDGRIVNIHISNGNGQALSFTPSVIGWTNTTTVAAASRFQLVYVDSTELWYSI